MSDKEHQLVTSLLDQIGAMVRDHGPGVSVSAGDLEVLTNIAALGAAYLNVRHCPPGPDLDEASERLELVHRHLVTAAFKNTVEDKAKVGMALAAICMTTIGDRHRKRLWWVGSKGGEDATG